VDTSSILINEIVVNSRIERLNSVNNIQEIDTSILKNITNESLAVLLSEYANVSIKSYGVSGISSLSIRGGSSEHTAVIWNGFNLQDQLNGGFNFSLASSFIADNIKIKYGGSSAIYGSGAMGGTIHLSNNISFDKGFGSVTQVSLGSFGKTNIQEKLSWSNKRVSFWLKGFYSKIDNDFPYKNLSKIGHPVDTLKDAKVEQYGLLLGNDFNINKHQLLTFNFWTQKNYTQVPPNMISLEKSAEQYDYWSRGVLNWKYTKSRFDIEAKSGVFFSKLNYINDNLKLDVLHYSINNINELIANFRVVKRSVLEVAVNNNFTSAVSDNFTEKRKLNKTAFFTSFKSKLLPKTIINVNARVELVDGYLKPVTYGLFSEYGITRNMLVNMNISKNHRSPNFNDMYWTGAYAKGNPNLKDENGYTSDFSFIEKYNTNKISLSNKISIFYNNTTDMIQWVDNGNYWTPFNQKQVQSTGVEYAMKTGMSISKASTIDINVNYSYTKAKILKKTDMESSDVLGKQLIYTPMNKANVFVNYNYKKMSVAINTKYTGEQYTRSDNKDSIPDYTVVNMYINYDIEMKQATVSCFFKINNLFNVDYMQMQWYPMPPINFETGLTFKIN
jgi:iron complex outermembrane receptor protein